LTPHLSTSLDAAAGPIAPLSDRHEDAAMAVIAFLVFFNNAMFPP
jgi:hypothetical protein